MALAPMYTLTLDETAWLPVPLVFPWGTFADADGWAAELADNLLADLPAEVEGRDQLRDTAIALHGMPSPLPGAQERFWRTEYVGGTAIVAHLYITDTDARDVDDLLQLARAGIGGVVQTWRTIDGTDFDVAVEAVVIAEIDDRRIGAIRHLGIRDGHVFLVDPLDEDPFVLDAVEGEMERIFRSIRFA